MDMIRNDLIPTKEKMFKWTTEIFNQGIRRPGYLANYRTESWIKDQFEELGLENIKLNPIKVKKWEIFDAHLRIWDIKEPNNIIDIPCFPIPYTKSLKNLKGELTILSKKEPISKKIAVSYLNLLKFPVKIFQKLPGIKRIRTYDPDNEFKEIKQLLPFDIQKRNILDSKMLKEALGFIGILSGFPWETEKYYVPYDAVERSITGVYVSSKNGKRISDFMEKGNVMAEITSETEIKEVISHNITGSLLADSDEWVIIGTHHDGPWNSAVEDASGMTLVLALAKYWSQLPSKSRPFNLMFLMNCAHMAGAKGAQSFVKNHTKLLDKTIAAIHIEHVARDVKSEDGKLIPLDDPTVRWWFVSRISELENIVEDAINKEHLRRSIILPPEGFPPGSDKPPTDGCFYHTKSIPFISFLTAPPYLFDPADTLDKVHQDSFVPLTRAFIQIINDLRKYKVKELRDLALN